jgi:tetratricopeptide (TPR) repeat protein
MNFKKRSIIAFIGLFALILLVGCAVSESFKQGELLSKNNRWDDAIVFYEKAVSENPSAAKYQEKLALAKREAAKIHYASAAKRFDSAKDMSIPALDQIIKEAKRAYDLDGKNTTIADFYNKITTYRSQRIAELKELYEQSAADMDNEDWLGAVKKLRLVNELFPGYEEAGDRLARAEQQGTQAFYKQGIEFGKNEEWKLAAQSFKAAMEINPDFLDVQSMYDKAKAKDDVNYYIAQGNQALRGNDLEKALFFYEKAMEYQPDNEKLGEQVATIKDRLGKTYFDLAVKFTQQGRLYQATEKITLAKDYSPSIQDGILYGELLNNLSRKLLERADGYAKEEMWGNALVWLEKAEAMNPDYPELFYRVLAAKDAITKRIKKSIAVFDFGSPSNNKDAGKIVANKLITYLHTNASGDVKIIERENLQSILREMQLGQTGLVDVKTAQAAKMRGIDTFILGDVLQYSVKSRTHQSSKQVKVLVDTEMVPNPDFTLWLLQHPKASQEEWKHAPPKEREKKNYQLISYNSGETKINSLIEISYKLVNTTTGENLATDTVSGRLLKEDSYQDEVPMAKIPYDPVELPSELEVLDELSNEKVSQVGQDVLKHFQSLEVEYFNEGQVQMKRRRFDQAIERFMDATYDEKLKRISTPISKQSAEIVDSLIKGK